MKGGVRGQVGGGGNTGGEFKLYYFVMYTVFWDNDDYIYADTLLLLQLYSNFLCILTLAKSK